MKKMVRKKKGVILAFVALLLPALIGIVGLSIDLAQAYTLHSRLKNALDLSAAAGLSKLSPDIDEAFRLTEAKSEVIDYLNDNLEETVPDFPGVALGSPDLDLDIGIYDNDTGVFTPDESDPDAVNAINVTYTLTFNANFSTIFMLDSFDATASTISTKVPSAYAPEGTTFPIAVNESTLVSLPFGTNTKRLYVDGTLTNSYFTSFDGAASLKTDIDALLDYFDSSGGVEPPIVQVNDTFSSLTGAGDISNLFMSFSSGTFDDVVVVLPVISESATFLTVKAFIGAEISDAGTDVNGRYVDVTFLPGYIDSHWKGTRVGTEAVTVLSLYRDYIAQSVILVE